MATATMAKSESKTRTLTLLTDRPGSRWIIEPNDVARNERGTVTGRLPGTVLQFDGAVARISEQRNPGSGEIETLCNGTPQGWDFDAFERAVRAHPQFNVRFWVEDKGPHDAQPTVAEMAAEIAEADSDRLRELREQERSTHNRPAVLELIADRALADSNGSASGGTDDSG